MSARARRMLELMDRATARWVIPVVGRAKGRVIRGLVERHQPRRAVEIGSLLGYSAILIADAMPRDGRLTCIEVNPFLAWMVGANAKQAGLERKVKVVAGDALREIASLPAGVDFALIDADKEQYRAYLRRLEPRLAPGAVVVADNTGMFRRDVADYLRHVRRSGLYDSREHAFGGDAMEVSVYRPVTRR